MLVIDRNSFGTKFRKGKFLLLLFLPCLIYLIFFVYVPMWGVSISFKDYKIYEGFLASPWVGFKYFIMFFQSPDALILIRNTFLLGFYTLLFGFPAPIIFALALNEVRNRKIKGLVQNVSTLPYFISQVVVMGMVLNFLSPVDGIINRLINFLGGETVNFMMISGWFRSIYVISDIWQNLGWGAIIYIAALSNVDVQLYDAAVIDGCNKMQKIWHIDIPSITPTIITLLLINVGKLFTGGNVYGGGGFEKVLLLYNPTIYETADIIYTYVYRQGLSLGNYSYSTAVNLFQNVVNLVLLVSFNKLSRRYSETSLY
ncbi:MAG: sugar ABC transporter permease [Ruminiclostridium sp.]|nr:sugar ABC transporter permease [Ruminiclostridium sp.]